MDSLIIALVLLFGVGFWGVFETGRKFRKEFKKRGASWQQLCADMDGGGTIIVDTLWGTQRGLGHPVIWYSRQRLIQGGELQEELERHALLVRCPKEMRSPEALRGKFGPERIVVHTWQVDLSLVASRG